MLKNFLKGLKLHTQTPAFLVITVAAGFLFGLAFDIDFLLLLEETWIPMGGCGAMAGMIGLSVMSYMSYPGAFMLALSMGRTRKEFLIFHTLERLLWTSLIYGLILLLTWLEQWVCAGLLSRPGEFDLLAVLVDPRVSLTAVPVLALMEMFFGALYGCFGKPVHVAIYVMWIGLCMNTSRWIEKVPQLLQPHAALFPALGICVSAGMLLVAILLGRKQSVR